MKCYPLTLILLVASAAIASAVDKVAAPAVKETNLLEILSKGGLMMYPLGILSVITVLLIFIFILTIRRNAIVSDRFMATTEAMLQKGDYNGLLILSHRRNECMARVVQKALDFMTSNPAASFESVREVTQAEGSHQAGMLTSRITYLADIGGIAPMVGLLGTVVGMIKAFIEISSGGVQGVRQMGLAEGVSEALIATAGGLAISIPALAFYSIFRGKVQKYVSELEAAATHFIAILQMQHERQAALVAPRLRDEFGMSVASPLVGERPDVQGV